MPLLAHMTTLGGKDKPSSCTFLSLLTGIIPKNVQDQLNMDCVG